VPAAAGQARDDLEVDPLVDDADVAATGARARGAVVRAAE
jgi:hypothetical protein